MKVIVVYGAPCSGKSTYVGEAITENDIAFDYDLLTRAMTRSETRNIDRSMTHPIVQLFEWSLFTKLRETYEGMPERLFYTTRDINDFLKEKLKGYDVEYVKMDATKEECLERLDKDDTRPDKEEWAKKIEAWFNKYGERAYSMVVTHETREERTDNMTYDEVIIAKRNLDKKECRITIINKQGRGHTIPP